jgi:hypothetical protein
VHRLTLQPKNKSGYKDVYPVHRKKRPWQAKVWDESRRTHVSLGSFATEQEAAVAVAVARADGIENLPSPDKSRAARGSGGAPAICVPPLLSVLLPLMIYCVPLALRRKAEARGNTSDARSCADFAQLPSFYPATALGDVAAARSR